MGRKRNQHRNKLLNYANGYRHDVGLAPAVNEGRYNSLVNVDTKHAYRYGIHSQAVDKRKHKPSVCELGSNTSITNTPHDYNDRPVTDSEHAKLKRMHGHEYHNGTMRRHRIDAVPWIPSAHMTKPSTRRITPQPLTATEIALNRIEFENYRHLLVNLTL